MKRLLAVLPLALLPLAACGDAEPAAQADGATKETVTVEHRFGTTEVSGVPQRVVALDDPWADTLLAFGVEPVAYAVDTYAGVDPKPWQDLGDAEGLDTTDAVPLEQVAALAPDLIVGTHSIVDSATYDRLSGIAPTIAATSEEAVMPWRDLVATAGDVLGEPERAEELVAEVDAEVAAAAAELPGLAGRTFALSQYVVGDSIYAVADPEDGSSELFRALGMELHPPLVEEAARTGEVRVRLSTERADLLRADLLAFLVNGGDESDLSDIPGFDALPGTVAVLDYSTIVALNTPSVLSVPYALEQLRPYLEQAAA